MAFQKYQYWILDWIKVNIEMNQMTVTHKRKIQSEDQKVNKSCISSSRMILLTSLVIQIIEKPPIRVSITVQVLVTFSLHLYSVSISEGSTYMYRMYSRYHFKLTTENSNTWNNITYPSLTKSSAIFTKTDCAKPSFWSVEVRDSNGCCTLSSKFKVVKTNCSASVIRSRYFSNQSCSRKLVTEKSN